MSAYANNIIEACSGKHWVKLKRCKANRKCRTCGKTLLVYNRANHCYACRMKHKTIEYDEQGRKLRWKDV